MDYKAFEAGQKGDSFWDVADNELKAILLNKIKTVANPKILNIGCGTGEDTIVLGRFGQVYLADINEAALDLIPDCLCVEKKVADATALPYQDACFDVVSMFAAIEHINNDIKAVQEAHRVLKESGFFILTGPAYQWLYSSHDKALNHYRRYNIKQLRSLTEHGFSEIAVSYWNTLMFIPVALIKVINKNSKTKLHNVILPKIIDVLLLSVLRLENIFVKLGLRMPFGANFYAIYQKKTCHASP